MFKNGKRITKKVLRNFSNVWEFSDYDEIVSYLQTDLDYYIDETCSLRIKDDVCISDFVKIENSIFVFAYFSITEKALQYLNDNYSNKTIIIETIDCYYEDKNVFERNGFNKQIIVNESKDKYLKEHLLNRTYYYINKPTDFLDKIYKENISWSSVDVSKIEFKKLSVEDTEKLIYNKCYSRYAQNNYHNNLFGFHYLGGCSFSFHNLDNYYIVGLYNDIIVSIISIETYDKTLSNGTTELISFVSYIDVREDIKKQGVATNMINFLNSTLNENDLIIGTDMSEEGQAANIHSVFSRILGSKWVNTFRDYYIQEKEKDLR